MHGYFISLKLYDTARIIANPFAYAEHREKVVRDKLDKMAETRIRSKKEVGVKVNKALAEKILKEEERAKKKEERKKKRKMQPAVDDEMAVDGEEASDEEEVKGEEADGKPSILSDPRFSKVFEDPEFAIDENTREFALLNPSAAWQKPGNRRKTAVEEEEEESDKVSSDGLGESESESGDDSDSDSSDAGELTKFDPRSRPGQKNLRAQQAYDRTREHNRVANINMVPMRATGTNSERLGDRNASFGQRLAPSSSSKDSRRPSKPSLGKDDGAMEISWVPSASSAKDDDGGRQGGGKKQERRKGVEVFGAGMEKGGEEVSESGRKGRTQRRKGVRSGSKNVFRRM